MTQYVATINTPGYTPESEPMVFDSAYEAWGWLTDQRREAEDDLDDDSDDYSDTVAELLRRTIYAYQTNDQASGTIDTVYGPTPGYDGVHDLGKAYSVDIYVE